MANVGFLGNRYWILRHGKSIPNEKGLIVSSMENGTLPEYQLASEGVTQATLAGETFQKELKEKNIPLKNVRICYSPFSRTTQTAKVVASVLNLPFEDPQCKVMEELRERFFGPSFELQSHDKYADIWALDEKDPFMKPEGGESVADVVSRLATAVQTMETQFQGCAVLIVSHGDPLQMLQTVFHATNQRIGPDGEDLMLRIQAVKVPSVLSQHRNIDCKPWCPLQMLFHATNQGIGPDSEDLMSRMQAVKFPSILSQHRKLLTGGTPINHFASG